MVNPHPSIEDGEQAVGRFLETLDAGARTEACRPFEIGEGADGDARLDWHYVPRERPGACLADLPAVAQKAALQVLATGLSIEAYALACAVMSLEDPLDVLEGGTGPRRHTSRRGWGRHRGEFSLVVFGAPGDERWGWRFEGHHLSVTATAVGREWTSVPHFLGANPASIGTLRLLHAEEDLALDLVRSLDAAQRRVAVVDDVAPDDILTTNVADVEGLLPPDQGLPIGSLDGASRELADRLVDLYLAREPSGTAHRPVDRNALRFSFAGVPERFRPQYYRLQSDGFVVEYDNTQNGANHVHTVVRRPGLDFGRDLLREHRRVAHPPDGG